MSFQVWAKPVIDLLAGFVPMDDWPEHIEDRWPRGKLRRTAMMAYDHLARKGEIRPQGVRREADGAVVVAYRAQIPVAWVHELLRRTEQRTDTER